MAFPDIPGGGRLINVNEADSNSSRSVDISAMTKNAGDLLIAICIAYQTTANPPFSGLTAGWNQSFNLASGTTMAVGIFYKWSDGTETSVGVTQDGTITGHASWVVLSIVGAHPTEPPYFFQRFTGTSTAANPTTTDPSGWGAEDTLWIAVAGSGEDSTAGAYTGVGFAPANYVGQAGSGMSGDVVGAVDMAVAFRQLNAATEDVGAWSPDTSNARNVAIHGAVRPAPSTTPIFPIMAPMRAA